MSLIEMPTCADSHDKYIVQLDVIAGAAFFKIAYINLVIENVVKSFGTNAGVSKSHQFNAAPDNTANVIEVCRVRNVIAN